MAGAFDPPDRAPGKPARTPHASVSLTRRGAGALAGSVALLLAGRVLGLLDLTMLGMASSALVVAALVAAWWPLRGPKPVSSLEVRRALPRRAHAGGFVELRVELLNTAPRMSPPLLVRTGGAAAPLREVVGPLAPGERSAIRRRLPAPRRGVLEVGPVLLEHEDPFALARAFRAVLAPAAVLVYPAVEPVGPLEDLAEAEPFAAARAAPAWGRTEDFASLRAYEAGDDVRRIHWPASAHTGELLVRRDEPGRSPRLTLLLDTRSQRHTAVSFERALSAAASLLLHAARRGLLVRLVTTGGLDSGMAGGEAHLARLLERLALAEPDPVRPTEPADRGLVRSLGTLRGPREDGAVLLTTTSTSKEELKALLHSLGRRTCVLACATRRGERGPWRAQDRAPLPAAVLEPGRSLAQAWHEALGALAADRGRGR